MDAAGSKSGRRKPGRAMAPEVRRPQESVASTKTGKPAAKGVARPAAGKDKPAGKGKAADKGMTADKGKAAEKAKSPGKNNATGSVQAAETPRSANKGKGAPSAPASSKPKEAAPAVMTKGRAGVIDVSVADPAAKAAPARPAAAAEKPAPAPERPAAANQNAAAPEPTLPSLDMEKLTQVSTEILTESGKAGAAMLKALETGEAASLVPDEGAEIAKTLGAVAQYWLQDPKRLVEAQKNISLDLINLWNATLHHVSGDKPEPVAAMPARDARFADPEWNEHPYFNFLKQAYFLGSNWVQGLVDKAETLDDHTKLKAAFYVRQLASALSPSNFVMTNPELLRTTIQEQGENIARGMKMLAEDIDAGKGELRIRQTDGSAFEVGKNLATTPGKVVFRNELFELIQYTPTTETVFKTPLLIVPPWINKFYILDLNPEKSFIRWAVSQGLTVFIISWVNPDARHRTYDFEAYMKKGVLEAIRQIEEATGEKSVDTIGYCVGGTLLAVTLAYIAQGKRPERIRSATFFTTQVDFTHAGELLAFVDEQQISAVEEIMAKFGYLPGEKMAGAFNMLRPNDLIWSYMVNNYLKGKQPPAFDLLFWNSDSTRMAEANHSYYLRNCYLHNRLAKGEMVIGGRKLDLKKVTIPIYNLAAKEDHIAPAKSVFVGSGLFGGPVTYVMAGSGHIAGVINPASKPKYQYWTGGPVRGTFEQWVNQATEHPGTWWPNWLDWVTKGGKRVAARMPGDGKMKPLADAPGTYVRIKA